MNYCTFSLFLAFITITSTLRAQTPVAPSSSGGKSSWDFSVKFAAKETYDDNVFLQDHSSLAHKRSMVSSFTPMLALGTQPCPAFKLAVSYAPEVVYYHSYASENYVAHRANLNLSGKSDTTAWEVNNAVTGIEGSNCGPTFDTTKGGAVPAIGGIPLRDRRDAIIYRNNVKVTQTIDKWFLRPVCSIYVHDFRTQQSAVASYENYIDRYELNGGLDIGYEACKKTWLVVGYRYGQQHQGTRLGVNSPYSSDYHRILAGAEGQPADWLKLSVLAGPDIRDFNSAALPATFDKDELLWYIDASAAVTLGKLDTLTALLTRFEQPAFSSHSVYQDVVYNITWKHQFDDRFTANLGLKIYEGNWQRPVLRDDWIYTPSAGLSCTFNKHFSADLAWSYDAVKSEVPKTTGREYTRTLVSLGAKYAF